jgi:hypothetical protein
MQIPATMGTSLFPPQSALNPDFFAAGVANPHKLIIHPY